MDSSFELALSPEGHLYIDSDIFEQTDSNEIDPLYELFQNGSITGLLHLGIRQFDLQLSPVLLFWKKFSTAFITAVCKTADPLNISTPDLQEFIDQAPFFKGVEYLNQDILTDLWQQLLQCLEKEIQPFSDNVQVFLRHYNPKWNLVGRVCFHLAENKANADCPFAFMATYTTQLTEKATAQHLPLKRALQDYAGTQNQNALLALLLPVQTAAKHSSFIKDLVDTGAIFTPQAWTPKEAHRFLTDIPAMESSGVMIRVPNWWNSKKPLRPQVVIKVGDQQGSLLGLDAMLDFKMDLTLSNGEVLSQEEWQQMLSSSGQLIKLKGQWVEVNQDKLKEVLAHWNNLQKAAKDGISMSQGLRLLAGAGMGSGAIIELDSGSDTIAQWSSVMAGDWLKDILHRLRNPNNASEKSLENLLDQHLKGVLRPYQLVGVQWLWLLYRLKLGGCLADDMGLGKTIQVLSLLLTVKHQRISEGAGKKPHLLIVPASLLNNWQAEACKFAPSLSLLVAHSSMGGKGGLKTCNEETLQSVDIVLTTYAFAQRMDWLKEVMWDLIILDEAQSIKNPSSKQAQIIKGFKSDVRFALTGTPIENGLTDLWSLFDFTSPGLLGSSKVFAKYAKRRKGKNREGAGSSDTNDSTDTYPKFISALRSVTQPYILRRLKSDKRIISDLPDKTEMKSYCHLTEKQVEIYKATIEELKAQLNEIKKNDSDGIKRRGLVLAYLLRFKQICNHPDQCLGYGGYEEALSGKFLRLREICEEIAAKQEKVLIFTQFKEVIAPLAAFLKTVFSRDGLVLHGQTPIKKRGELVASFQEEQGPPFFVLSLKAGGTGLTLTRAAHVIHFDRWWNPAVENQATDRAYRIGQKHPVLVHKFICAGTIEEKIDTMISDKKNLSNEILEGDSEVSLTELTDDELMKLVSIDIDRAMGN